MCSLLKLERLINTVFSFHFYVTQFSSSHVNNPYWENFDRKSCRRHLCFSFFILFSIFLGNIVPTVVYISRLNSFSKTNELSKSKTGVLNQHVCSRVRPFRLEWFGSSNQLLLTQSLKLILVGTLIYTFRISAFTLSINIWTMACSYGMIAYGGNFNSLKRRQSEKLDLPRTALFVWEQNHQSLSQKSFFREERFKKINPKLKIIKSLSSMFEMKTSILAAS